MTYVLDACTVFRYLDDEAGSDRVDKILIKAAQRQARVLISAIQWEEVIQIVLRRNGLASFMQHFAVVNGLALTIEPVTATRAERSAHNKFNRGIANADCFAIELAGDSTDHVLVTSDFGLKPAEQDVHLEFLPAKQWPTAPAKP